MNDGILTARHIIPAFEADAASLWRPEAIFRLMQELAGEHSDRLDCGRETLLERGIVWMLARASLRMERYPRFHETVCCETWPGPTGRVTFPRYYTFADENGDPLGCASTSWMLVDLTTRRILPTAKAGLVFPDTTGLTPPIPEPGRLRLACGGEPRITERAPLYGDVDMNGHMNNGNYIAWITDLFPLSRHQSGRIRELTIHYAAEAVPGERLTLALYEDGPAFEVRGADAEDGHVVFEAKGLWG